MPSNEKQFQFPRDAYHVLIPLSIPFITVDSPYISIVDVGGCAELDEKAVAKFLMAKVYINIFCNFLMEHQGSSEDGQGHTFHISSKNGINGQSIILRHGVDGTHFHTLLISRKDPLYILSYRDPEMVEKSNGEILSRSELVEQKRHLAAMRRTGMVSNAEQHAVYCKATKKIGYLSVRVNTELSTIELLSSDSMIDPVTALLTIMLSIQGNLCSNSCDFSKLQRITDLAFNSCNELKRFLKSVEPSILVDAQSTYRSHS